MDYSKAQIDEAWNKATIDENNDPKIWRKDPCGAWINYEQYGKHTDFGWNIDHIIPNALFVENQGDFSGNRWAMHWENNKSKSSDFPEFNIAIKSKGTENTTINEKVHYTPQKITELINLIPSLIPYIQEHKNEWIKIYEKDQVEKWIRNN
jgi:hypothetical protein